MKTSRIYLSLALCLMGLSACQDVPTGPTNPSFNNDGPPVVVMTRNLYVGADLDAVVGALLTPDPDDDLPALGEAIATMQATDFGARAAAIVAEIARSRPVAIGLQEVSTIQVPTPQGLLVIDYLPILQAMLAGAGLNYVVAAEVTNIDLALPLGGGLAATLIDRDVLLVAGSAQVVGTSSANFSTDLPLGFTTIKRGWVRADLRIAGKTISVVSTHLESGPGGPGLIRQAQAAELIGLLPTGNAVILMGDLNDVPGSPMHGILSAGGLVDVWAGVAPAQPGYTCCHLPDLSNPASVLDQRIDYVMVRGGFMTGNGKLVGGVRAEIIGEEVADRIPRPAGSIWPSDHAGLVVSLPPAR